MDRLIDPDKLMVFCGCHDICQSGFDGELVVVIGQTSRGDDVYRSLYEFDEIYADDEGTGKLNPEQITAILEFARYHSIEEFEYFLKHLGVDDKE